MRFACVDNCLFYRVNDVETTFKVLFIDDTLIFSKRQEDIDQFSARLNRHCELTLDAKADSFLGIYIEHRNDGTVLLIQPQLLQFMPSHPYGPAPAYNATTIKEQSPLIPVTTY